MSQTPRPAPMFMCRRRAHVYVCDDERTFAPGSTSQTVVGRPTVPGAEVHVLVEEQMRDVKKLTFKKRRRKNSRRLKGHRAQLTGLRILDVVGIDEE